MKSKNDICELRAFGRILSLVLALLTCLEVWRGRWPLSFVMGLASASVFIVSFFHPALLKPFYDLLMSFAEKVGWLNTRLILAVLYYLLFTPIAVFLRMTRKDPLERKIEPHRKSYWIPRGTASLSVNRYERQY